MPLVDESSQGAARSTGAGRSRDPAQRDPLIVREKQSAAAHIEQIPRTVKHVLAAGTCQVQSEDAYDGHLVLRLMGCLALFYTSRVICKGRLTMEEIIFNLKHYWRFVDSEAF